MFGLPSIGKLLVLVAICAAVWYGFKYVGRMDRIRKGDRKTGERGLGERLRRAARGKSGDGGDTEAIEDTEKCPVCEAYVSVEGISSCGKPRCPY